MSYLRVSDCRAVVKLLEPKKKFFGENGIDCIFIGCVEHSKAYRFYVIETNDSVSVNSVIESRDAIFDENRFSLLGETPNEIPENLREVIELRYLNHMDLIYNYI